MSAFAPLPLGARIPDRLHAVSCSLPTMRDVVGYEEKHAETVARLSSGYPRFVVHPLLADVALLWARRFERAGERIWIASSPAMARALAAHLAPAPARVLEHDGLAGVAHADTPALRGLAKSFLQHAGGFASSRAAEEYLVRHGARAGLEPEALAGDDAAAIVRRTLAPWFAPAVEEDILLATSGMNAFWAAFHAVAATQAARGRDTWLQVGWLYLDTSAILAKFTGGRHVNVVDVRDHAALEAALREHGPRLAGVVTEAPTNPLLTTPDLAWLAARVREAGALLLVDPSLASPFNVDVTPHADLVLNSLTKYAASEGDVIAGAVVVTPRCPDRARLRAAIAERLEPLHPRDLRRLAAEIGGYAELLPRLNANARVVIDHLAARPTGVRRLHWSLQPETRENHLRLARAPDRIGPVFSFQVDGAVAAFFDAVPLPKGPSFGMTTTLLCPFVYLAHYDLVTSEAGRATLARADLPADLLRMSVGLEPPEDILAALECGFAALAAGARADGLKSGGMPRFR